MGLDEALNELEGVDPQDFASALKDKASSLYKAIRTPAYKEGKSEAEKETEKAREKIASLKKEKQGLESKIEGLKGEQPEVAEIRGRYESKLEDMQEKLQQKEKEKQELESQANGRLLEREKEFFQEKAKSWLMQQGHVADPDIADIKVQRAIQSGRVQFGDDLTPKVYEDDGEVPTPIPDGKQPHEVFAASVLDSIPDKFIESRTAHSTGLGSTNGSGRKRAFSREEINNMSDEEYAKNREAILEAGAEGRVR